MDKKDNKQGLTTEKSDRKNSSVINTNIEKLLLKATDDKKLGEELLQDRNSILENPEFSLSAQDKMILKSIPGDRLKDMIEKFALQKRPERKIFKGAALIMALLTTSYLDMVHYNRIYTLKIIPYRAIPIDMVTSILLIFGKPVVSLYIATILFKIKQNFWRISGTAFLTLFLDGVIRLASGCIFYYLFGYNYFDVFYLYHGIFFILFSAIAIKFIFNIKWLTAGGISIVNFIFLFVIIPSLFFVLIYFYYSGRSLLSQ